MIIYLELILQAGLLIAAIFGFVVGFRNKEGIKVFIGLISAILSFLMGILVIKLPAPQITRLEDYSAIKIYTDKGVPIQYKIRVDGKEEWKEYTEPIKIKQTTVVSARTRIFLYKSEEVYRDVFVEDNGLIDFGGADIPKKSLKQLKASYTYKDPQDDRAGNYYAGCEIAKNDIQVNGTDLDGNTTEVTDFTYSPQILQSGKNDIKISYTLVNGATINTHLYIEATQPKLIRLKADCKEKTWFSGVELSNDDLTVKGTYEDGTEKEVTGYALSETKIKQGKNKIVVTKDGLSVEVIINAVDKDSILKELKLDGLVNGEEEVIEHLEANLTGSSLYYPLRRNQNGLLGSASKALPQEKFETVLAYTRAKQKELKAEMYEGEVSALPYLLGEDTGCDFCACKDICGFDQRIEGCEYRQLQKYSLEEAVECMKEKLGIKKSQK